MEKKLFMAVLDIVHMHLLIENHQLVQKHRENLLNDLIQKKIKCIQYIDLYHNYFRFLSSPKIHRLDIRHHGFYYEACQLCKKHLQIICREDGMIYFMCLSCQNKTHNIFE